MFFSFRVSQFLFSTPVQNIKGFKFRFQATSYSNRMLDLIVRLGVQLHTFSAAKINGVCDAYFVNVNVYVIFIQNFEGQICERTLERHLIKRLGV